MKQHGLDFEDAANYQAAVRLKAEGVISFDGDFDDLPQMTRVEPREIQ